MLNSKRQEWCNKQKWYVSEANGKDQSGKMYWCGLCDYKQGVVCKATQDERDCKCLCATAFNRYKRSKGAKNGKEKSTD